MKTAALAFTGTSEGMTTAQFQTFKRVLASLQPEAGAGWVFHGGCVGADAQCHRAASLLGWATDVSPGHIPNMRDVCPGATVIRQPRHTLERNKFIAANGEVLVATPKTPHEEQRSGTWMTVRHARKLKKTILIIWPDGSVKLEGPDATRLREENLNDTEVCSA